jgi:hypothetical protein
MVCLIAPNSQVFSQKSKSEKKKMQYEKLQHAVVDSQLYEFIPQNSIPMGGRSQSLTDFSVKISKIKIESYLPYFGVSQSVDLASSNSSPYDFTSTDYSYSVAGNSKKGGWDITIVINDSQDSKKMFFTILKNGTATLQVTNNNRQVMTFNGYVQVPVVK